MNLYVRLSEQRFVLWGSAPYRMIIKIHIRKQVRALRPITVDTKMIALLGMPLGQSFSPDCQNMVYEEMGWDYCYFPAEIECPDDLPHIINGIRRMNFAGFAVTKPFKVEVVRYLDEIDEIAQKMGSCNTVQILGDGRLKGYNTDGYGAIRSFTEDLGVVFEGNTFFVFGAGGAGRSICMEIASRAPKCLFISDMSDVTAEVCGSINSFFPGTCVPLDFKKDLEVDAAIAQSDVLVNASGIGMAPYLDRTPLNKAMFKPGHICFDATYNPLKTRFLMEAEEMGCRIQNGLNMMVYQGTKQMHIWTGEDEPVDVMKRCLEKVLGQYSRYSQT